MGQKVDTAARTVAGYEIARRAIDLMEAQNVWVTALNFEIWQHVVADPECELAQEVRALMDAAEPLSDVAAQSLAGKHLPRLKITEDVRDAGETLSRQLATVSQSIDAARAITADYARELAGAQTELSGEVDVGRLQGLVEQLADATTRAHDQSSGLETRLTQSTVEVRQLREQLERVRREVMIDGLTQLTNRKGFDEAVEAACRTSDLGRKPVTLALVDIDHFKRVNDTWGHQTGDQVIRYVAATLDTLGDPRIVARYGGEEFAVLFPGELAQQVVPVLERVRVNLSKPVLRRKSSQEEIGRVTVSFGLAQRCPNESAAAWIERADAALYVSKRSGRDRITDAGQIGSMAA